MIKLIEILAVALGAIGSLSADAITYTVAPNSGEFLYQFTLSNTGDTGGTLFDLFLSLPADISDVDTTTIGTPAGWGDSTGGLLFFGPDVSPATSFVEWSAEFSGLYDLQTGGSLTGFSFRSSKPGIDPILFSRNGSPTFSTAEQVSAVPEPASAQMIVAILATVAFVQCRHRRRCRLPLAHDSHAG